MPLLERDDAVAALVADLASAGRGAGRIVLVSGEAGIGKTSLVEHFVRAADPAHLLWGACDALFTPHPLGPLHELARASKTLHRMLVDGTDRAALFTAVLDELAGAPRPALLVLEDVHWADAATLDLIRFVGRRIHRLPALMVLTYRDDAVDVGHLLRATLGHLPPQHVRRLALSPLSPRAVSTLASASGRDDAALHAVTGGNPFFVTEVLASAAAGVPATVRDAILGRADELDAAAHAVLSLVSIVPRAIESWLVERLLEASGDAVERCVAGGLLVAEPQTLRFRHELARIAFEDSVAPPTARRSHAAVLAALTEPGAPAVPLARLVHHAQSAADGPAVLRFARQAAREAAGRGARREAASHGRIALQFADALPDAERAELLEDHAGHCFELNDLAAAIAAREAAIALFERLHDGPHLARSLARHAMPLVRALRNADADAASRRAIAVAETLADGGHRAVAYANEAYLRMLNRDYADAVDWGRKAIALAERHDDRPTLAAAYTSVGTALLFVDYPRGCGALRTALAIASDLDDGGVAVADAHLMLGTASGEVYALDGASRALVDGIAFARAHDLDRQAGYMAAWQALVDVYRGHWDVAGERAHAVLARERAGSTNRLMALVALGRLRVRRGDPGADDVLDEAVALASQSGTLQRVAPVRCARAEAAWLRGDLDGVRREATSAFGPARANGHPWFVGELAYWLGAGDRSVAAPRSAAAPYALQMAGRWADAAGAWKRLGCPYESARALAEGDATAQREALVLFDSLGARPMADRLRARLRAAGVSSIPRGPRPSTRGNAAGLTAREVEVLTLVAQGMQNAQIAATLFRSTRTVEHHVASILAKLGVATRAEAVTAARDRGLVVEATLPKMGSDRARSG